MNVKHCFCLALTLLSSPLALAAEWDFSGSTGVEGRVFFQEGLFPKQHDEPQLSIYSEIELDGDTAIGDIKLKLFARGDNQDSERSHFDVREAYWRQSYGDLDVLLGINQVFWGVTESRHLVNVVNTIDAVENLDGEDYLGQPMLNLTWFKDFGKFEAFLLPFHRALPFSGSESRFLITELPIKNDAVYLDNAAENYLSTALRYSHYFDDWDVGLHYFHGVSREAIGFDVNGDVTVVPDVGVFPNSLTPVYEIINQVGMDVQLTSDDWLYKLESIIRGSKSETFAAMTGGFEYSIYQLFESDKDLGMILEYSYDGREQDALMNNDLFSGLRLAFNDTQSTEILAGVITDVEDGSTSVRIEAERRLGDSWKVELEGQLFETSQSSNPIYTLRQDDFVALRLNYYF